MSLETTLGREDFTALVDAVKGAVAEVVTAPPAPQPELLDRGGMAAILGVGVSTFDRMCKLGEIGPASFRLGGSPRWHLVEVRAWLANRDHRGELHNSKTWGPTWEVLKRRAGVAR